jgi:NAD(P) transhydrogenase
MPETQRYDLIVIGSGPAGQKGAIAAAKMGKSVAVVDRKKMTGGVCIHTGTIPSKTLREAILYLSGFSQRAFYGMDYRVKDDISVQDLAHRVRTVIAHEVEVVRAQLKRNGVDLICGEGRLTGPRTVEVETEEGPTRLEGDNILIAVGTSPAHAAEVPLDGVRVFDSDQLLKLERVPHSVVVVGAGVVGLEYASMFTALGCEVTLIDQRKDLLPFVDRELIEALCFHLRRREATFRLGETLTHTDVDERGRVVAHLKSGKKVAGDALLYTVGRQANTAKLGLEAAGLETDDRGRLRVDAHMQTAVPHIYAAGDVVGFPALASTSMEQGRVAALHMFGKPAVTRPELLPYGIFSVPEMSMVGLTEEEATRREIPYAVGTARYEELAKGQMLGDHTGFLKLLFDPDSHKLMGVHAIGEGAVENIHIGQAVLAHGGVVDYFRDAVFNYPTLAEAYKVAAFDGLNRL